MSKLDRWIDNKIVQNLFIWVFLFLILLTTIQADNRALVSLFAILLLAPAVYVNNLFILPFLRKKTPVFLLLFLVNAIVFATICVFILNTSSNDVFQWFQLVNFFGIMVLALIFGSAIKLTRDSFERRQQEKEAELKLLKAQLNPHFLFNTMNNLYGLSVIKSDKLPNLMLKLSDLLRYSLYETKETYVSIEKEITYLENYISLEKIRLEDKTDIEFNKVDTFGSKDIAPMLFIVFVENAFKHLGVSKDGKSKVSVNIKKENGKVYFTCDNTIDLINTSEENLEKGKSGIGLQNAIKRLDLMYPDKHTLNISEENGMHSVKLILEI